jgi:RPA family protein
MAEIRKRETAHKLKIGDILMGTPIIEDVPQEAPAQGETLSQVTRERFRFLELGDKKIIRVNIIANIIDKYLSDGEKKFATVTIDDASGQIRLKVFGEDTVIFNDMSQGDTILTIGVLRSYNGELYLLPEIVKKTDPRYLLVRKLELEKKSGIKREIIKPEKSMETRDQVIDIIRSCEDPSGVSTEEIILKIKSAAPEVINSEIIKLIEEGTVYEPRPGKVRYLG